MFAEKCIVVRKAGKAGTSITNQCFSLNRVAFLFRWYLIDALGADVFCWTCIQTNTGLKGRDRKNGYFRDRHRNHANNNTYDVCPIILYVPKFRNRLSVERNGIPLKADSA